MKYFATVFGLLLVVACGESVDPVGERRHIGRMDAGSVPVDAGDNAIAVDAEGGAIPVTELQPSRDLPSGGSVCPQEDVVVLRFDLVVNEGTETIGGVALQRRGTGTPESIERIYVTVEGETVSRIAEVFVSPEDIFLSFLDPWMQAPGRVTFEVHAVFNATEGEVTHGFAVWGLDDLDGATPDRGERPAVFGEVFRIQACDVITKPDAGASSLPEEEAPSSEEPAETPQLLVTPVRGIPLNGTVYLGSVHEPLLCFVLEARGGRFLVTPPLIHIEPLDGGSATTASETGVVFPFPSLEGEEILYGPTKVSPLESGGVSPWTWRDSGGVTLERGSEQTFCVYADVTDWSETSEDFFNKTFQVVMDAWVLEDAVLLEPDGTERLFLDTSHIVSPDAILGDPFIVTSPDGDPSDRYTGTLELLSDDLSPFSTEFLAGQDGVPLFPFRLRANGAGGCVREITLHVQPRELAEQAFSRIYLGQTDGELLHGRDIYLDAGIDRWGFPDSPSFCLEGGKEVRYFFYVDLFENAPPGVYDFWIDPTDLYRFAGEVVGEEVRSTVTVTD